MSRLRERAVGHEPERHSSVWGWAIAGVLTIIALQPVIEHSGRFSDYSQRIILLIGINIVLAVSLNVINGITGQFSIGHAGFMAIGAYVSAALTVFGGTALETAAAGGALDPANPPLNLWLLDVGGAAPGFWIILRAQCWFVAVLFGAGLAAALAGYLVGQPTLRLRGDYLAIATLGFSEMVRVVLLNVQVLGGASGFTGAAPFNSLPAYSNFANIYLAVLLCVLMVTCLKRSTHGRALLAVREDEVAAEAVGIDTARYKVLSFVFSSFFAGVAGGLYAHLILFVIPNQTMFGFMRSIEAIVMVVLGGSGSTTGAVLAAAVVTWLPERLRDVAEYRMVLYAEMLLVLMLVRRQGLLGSREITSRDWFRLFHFLRCEGILGVPRSAWAWLRGCCGSLAARLRPHEGRTDPLAVFLFLVPVIDLACARLLRLPDAATSSYFADLTSSLSALVPQALGAQPGFAVINQHLQLPLKAELGLTIALLPMLLPWYALSTRVAAGDARAARLVAIAGAVLLWHGGGLWFGGARTPRTSVEALLALALVLWAGARWWRRRGHGAA